MLGICYSKINVTKAQNFKCIHEELDKKLFFEVRFYLFIVEE